MGAQTTDRSTLEDMKSLVARDGTSDRFISGETQTGQLLQLQLCDIDQDLVPEFGFDPQLTALLVLASRSDHYRDRLLKLGYLAAEVDPLLRSYEDSGIARAKSGPASVFDTKNEKTLARKINGLPGRRARHLLSVDLVANQCGGTPRPPSVTFVVSPAQGRAFLIPEFFARVCEVHGRNAFDMQACPGWTEVFDGGSRALYGTYRYASIWPGKPTRTGSITVDNSTAVRFSP